MKKSDAVKHFGQKIDLAKALGVSPAAVTQWPEDGIPMRRQYELERITDGQLKASLPGTPDRNAA